MTGATTPDPTQHEPELAGPTVVVIGGSTRHRTNTEMELETQ